MIHNFRVLNRAAHVSNSDFVTTKKPASIKERDQDILYQTLMSFAKKKEYVDPKFASKTPMSTQI